MAPFTAQRVFNRINLARLGLFLFILSGISRLASAPPATAAVAPQPSRPGLPGRPGDAYANYLPQVGSRIGSIYDINHLVIIYQENWSFDGLYGLFPGANGITTTLTTTQQVDASGTPYASLPFPGGVAITATLPVKPFDLEPYYPAANKTVDLTHAFYTQQLQIDGGKMDGFIAHSSAQGLVMSYYDASKMAIGQLAKSYTLGDNYFHAAFGGSFLNHFWLICACTPLWPSPPASVISQFDKDGNLLAERSATPDGYAVNTTQPFYSPYSSSVPSDTQRLPPQSLPTIGDRLSDANVTWAWYAQGWTQANAGAPDTNFVFHHQPFVYFTNFAPGTPARAAHLQDLADFQSQVISGTLPAVSFVKFFGGSDEHPGGSSELYSQQQVVNLVQSIMAGPNWSDTAILITYDEYGGRWDHVPPPSVDRWGPGLRVPLIIISPFAHRGYVEHTRYDTTSILKLIETRWGLAPLATRDAAATNLINAFNLSPDAP